MTVSQISGRELTRLRIMIDLADNRITLETAATLMGLGRRQVFRPRRAFSADGAPALISRKRGGPSNRRHGKTFRRTVLELVRRSRAVERDTNRPTFAAPSWKAAARTPTHLWVASPTPRLRTCRKQVLQTSAAAEASSLQAVTVGEGLRSTDFASSGPQAMDGRPAPTMTPRSGCVLGHDRLFRSKP
jgi:hypothetical protein